MKKANAQKIANETKNSYDTMAKEFSRTRAKFWDELIFLAEHATPGMKVLDVGCGNGRFFPVVQVRQIEYTGVDNSEGLLDEARKLHPEANFIFGDATALPFPDKSFDIAYSFAAIHHIPSRALRNKFVSEIARVLHSGNTFVLTTWYLWSPDKFKTFLWNGLKSILMLSPLDIGDIMLTFGKEKHTRYLHAFTESELKRLLKKNGFAVVGSEILERQSPQAPARTQKAGRPASATLGAADRQKNILIVARKI